MACNGALNPLQKTRIHPLILKFFTLPPLSQSFLAIIRLEVKKMKNVNVIQKAY